MIKKQIKTLYHDQAAVHQKYVHKALKSHTGLLLTYKGEKMELSYSKLQRATPADRKFRDKHTGKSYQLYYFRWRVAEPFIPLVKQREIEAEQLSLF